MATYPKTKKYLLHLKLSKGDNYLHEHELYEMMRSRELYNVHKDLRKKLCRTLRGIKDAERVHIATIEAQRLLFVQRAAKKVRERLRLTKIEVNVDVTQMSRRNNVEAAGNHTTFQGQHVSNAGSGIFFKVPHFMDRITHVSCAKGKEIIGYKSCKFKHETNACIVSASRLQDFNEKRACGIITTCVFPDLKIREQRCMETRRRNRDILDEEYSSTLKSRFQKVRRTRLENIKTYTQQLQRRVQDFNAG